MCTFNIYLCSFYNNHKKITNVYVYPISLNFSSINDNIYKWYCINVIAKEWKCNIFVGIDIFSNVISIVYSTAKKRSHLPGAILTQTRLNNVQKKMVVTSMVTLCIRSYKKCHPTVAVCIISWFQENCGSGLVYHYYHWFFVIRKLPVVR